MNQITALLITIVLFSCEPINTKKVISTDKAPQAIGPYSQAIQVNKTLYLAGQIALNPDTGQMVEDKIEVLGLGVPLECWTTLGLGCAGLTAGCGPP